MVDNHKIQILMKRILTVSFFLISWIADAQSFYNNGAIVTITSNTLFTVRDSLVNNGLLTNNGNMLIGGVWLNMGTYNPGNGEITFNNPVGAKPQVINHNSQSFNKLTISGGGEKLILADMTIVGELNLTSGLIVNENNSKVIFQPDAIINGGSDQSHIVGIVEQQGAGELLFPIGNGSEYLPVALSGVTDEETKALLQLHELNGEILTGGNEIAQLSTKRFWELNLTEGSMDNVVLTLPLRDENFSGDNTLWAIGESDSGSGTYRSIGQSTFTGDQTNGSVTSESVPSKSFFTVVSLSTEKNIIAYNGVSPNGDGFNDYFMILNIEKYPDNTVTIFNRWGDKVFELGGYDDSQNVFKGENNLNGGAKLPSGVYFYKIVLGDGSKEMTGYLELKNEPN